MDKLLPQYARSARLIYCVITLLPVYTIHHMWLLRSIFVK